MKYLPVHWSEGTFLRPHHFQAAERYWKELIETSEKWDHAHNYGLHSVKLSEEAIANYQIELVSCHARMKDGTLITIDPGQDPDRVDLKDAFQSKSVVRVYLAVPNLQLGQANVGRAGEANQHRFVATNLSLQDESFGGNDQDIELRNLSLRLIAASPHEEPPGYDLLPIGQIKRASDTESAPQLDQDYIPPCLDIDAWPPLSRDYVRAIYDIIGEKIGVLGEQVVSRGITLAADEPGDLERLFLLRILNEASGSLRCLAFAAGVHPFAAYTELCRIVGALSIFGPTRVPPEIPLYDHDDLARIFKWAKQMIVDLMANVRDYAYVQRFFIGVGRGMQVALDPNWLHASWEWYLGVNRGSISEAECRELLSAGNLDWKIGASEQVDWLFQTGAPGLQLDPLAHSPRALPAGGGWIYYQVSRGNAAWNEVRAKQSLAMRFREELIRNLDRLQGEKTLVVSSRGKEVELQIALFAVPQQ